MATGFLAQIEETYQLEDIDDYDKLYLAVEAVLGSACAYLYYHGEREFYRSSAIILFEDKYKDKIDIDPVQTSHRLRLAAKSANTKGFDKKALNFCEKVNKQISK